MSEAGRLEIGHTGIPGPVGIAQRGVRQEERIGCECRRLAIYVRHLGYFTEDRVAAMG